MYNQNIARFVSIYLMQDRCKLHSSWLSLGWWIQQDLRNPIFSILWQSCELTTACWLQHFTKIPMYLSLLSLTHNTFRLPLSRNTFPIQKANFAPPSEVDIYLPLVYCIASFLFPLWDSGYQETKCSHLFWTMYFFPFCLHSTPLNAI